MNNFNVNDDDLAYIYLAKKNVSLINPISNNSKYKYYYLDNQIILESPIDENDLTFKIMNINENGIFEVININPNTTIIDFYHYINEQKEKMFHASFDRYSSSWDFRIKKGVHDIPVSFEEALIYSNITNEFGIETGEGIIKILDCCKKIFEDNKKNKSNKYQKSP